MKDSVRRLVLFIVIVGLGSAMIFVDIPLVYMLLLIIAVGFVLLIVLGTITVAEIKNAFSTISPSNLRGRTFFGKSGFPLKSEKKPSAPKDAGEKKAQKTAPKSRPNPPAGSGLISLCWFHQWDLLGRSLPTAANPGKKSRTSTNCWNIRSQRKSPGGSALESAAAVPAATGVWPW